MDSVEVLEHGDASSVDHEIPAEQEIANTKTADHEKLQPPVNDALSKEENGQIYVKKDTEEIALKNALEKIEILEKEVTIAKDEVLQCKRASQEEISRLCNELQGKHESAESKAVHLAEELDIYKKEAENSNLDLQKTKEECEALKEKLEGIEKELSTAHQTIRESEENISIQAKSHQEELLKRDENEGSIKKAHEDTRVQLQTLQNRVDELETALSKASTKDDTIAALHKELESLKSKLEEESKEQESKFQAQLGMAEEKYASTVKSMSELEAKLSELEKSLAAATSDHGTAIKKAAELEHALEIESEKKAKLEEVTLELQEKLRVKDESLEKLEGNLNETEAKLIVSDEKLKASEVVAEGLQSQLTDLKTQNETQVKGLEETKQNLQLELQAKQTLEGKIKEQQELLDAAKCEAENFAKKVDDLNIYVKGLETEKFQLEEKLRASEDKCSEHVNTVQTSTARSLELEGIVVQHRTIVDDAVNKLAVSEATLVETKSRNSELEVALAEYQKKNEELQVKFDEAQEIVLRLQNEANESSSQITKLESLEKESATKVTELENVCADSKKREEVLSQKLESTEKLLADRQAEIDDATKRITELELSIKNFGTELTASSEKEKNLINEKELLEGKVAEMQIQVESATAKIVMLESSIAAIGKDLQDAVENKNHLIEEKTLLENKILNLSAELEQSVAKFSELETSYASSRQIEDELTKKLHSTEKMLEEKQVVLEHSLTEISELKASLLTVDSDLKKALENEKHHLDEISEAKSRLSALEPLVEKSKVDLQTAAVNERKLKEEISCHEESKSMLQGLISQLHSEKDAILSQHESSHKNLAELNEKLIQEEQQLQLQIKTLTKESNDLNEELRICKEQLQAKLAEIEASANQLQVSLSKEASFDKEVTDLKIQLEKALRTTEDLEEKLKQSIPTEEHKVQIDKLLATSQMYQDKLAEAEKKLSDTKFEIVKVQTAFNEREIHIKELEAKSEKSEVVDHKSSEPIKSRDIDLDFQSPGKARQRKKKGVTWELDNEKAKVNDKPAHIIHRPNQILVHVLFALVSLTFGFWIARKIEDSY